MDNTMNNELLPRKNGAIIFLECILIDIAILIAYALLRDKVIFQIVNMMCADSDYMVVALITCYVISFVFLIPLCFYLRKELKREIQEGHRIKWYKHVVRLFIDSLVVILLFLTIYATIGYLARDIFARIQINDSMQDYFSVSPVASFIYVCLLGPIVEELIFRGFIYKQMKDINKLFSIVLSSGLFAVMHQYYDFLNMPLDQFLCCISSYFILGVLLAIVYEKRGNIFYPITIHALINTLLTVLR